MAAESPKKQTQNKPNSNPNKPNFKMGNINIGTAHTKAYAKEQRTMNNEHYSKTNPIQTQTNPIINNQSSIITYPPSPQLPIPPNCPPPAIRNTTYEIRNTRYAIRNTKYKPNSPNPHFQPKNQDQPKKCRIPPAASPIFEKKSPSALPASLNKASSARAPCCPGDRP